MTTQLNDYKAINKSNISMILGADCVENRIGIFSSSSKNLAVVKGILKEGRSCLKRSFIYFKFFITMAIVDHICLLFCDVVVGEYEETMFIYREIVLYIPYCAFMGGFKTYKLFQKKLPKTSILEKKFMKFLAFISLCTFLSLSFLYFKIQRLDLKPESKRELVKMSFWTFTIVCTVANSNSIVAKFLNRKSFKNNTYLFVYGQFVLGLQCVIFISGNEFGFENKFLAWAQKFLKTYFPTSDYFGHYGFFAKFFSLIFLLYFFVNSFVR